MTLQIGQMVQVEYRDCVCNAEVTGFDFPRVELTICGSGKVIYVYEDECST